MNWTRMRRSYQQLIGYNTGELIKLGLFYSIAAMDWGILLVQLAAMVDRFLGR